MKITIKLEGETEISFKIEMTKMKSADIRVKNVYKIFLTIGIYPGALF